MRRPAAAAALVVLGGVGACSAVPVTGWVTTNGDAGFVPGSEATNAPVTTDANAETLVGSFPEVTLAVGESIELTGSVVVSGRAGIIPGNQIRWGLFDAPGTPTTGAGAGYVGVWAAANNGSGDIRSADGSTGNPFSSSATTTLVTASDPDGGAVRFDETLTFSLAISRLDETNMTVAGSLTNGADFAVEWPETTAPASPESFTYDAVGFLLGGTTEATSATYRDVEVSGAGAAPLVVAEIGRDSGTGEVVLTWTSVPGRFYTVESSSDLTAWPVEIDDSVAAAEVAETTRFAFEPADFGIEGAAFFRVSESSN